MNTAIPTEYVRKVFSALELLLFPAFLTLSVPRVPTIGTQPMLARASRARRGQPLSHAIFGSEPGIHKTYGDERRHSIDHLVAQR
jgi:hypothetical protein